MRKAACAVAAAALLTSCVLPGRGMTRLRAEARTLVAGLAADYDAGRLEAFFARFDPAAFPGFDRFRSQTEAFLRLHRRVVADLLALEIRKEGGGASVSVQWNRSYLDPSGMPLLETGRCKLTLRRRPSGELVVAALSGASPF